MVSGVWCVSSPCLPVHRPLLLLTSLEQGIYLHASIVDVITYYFAYVFVPSAFTETYRDHQPECMIY
jgi:hypothetical protein